LIKSKNVLQAFYLLLSKWHENIRTMHCDIFCCHVNCHTGKYFLKGTATYADVDDDVIQKNIYINYHFYGWNDDGTSDSSATVTAAIFRQSIVTMMHLPENQIITTWSSSRKNKGNSYQPSVDQLKLNLRFPSYHGSATRLSVYADYQINDCFAISETNYTYVGSSGDGLGYDVEVHSPVAILGSDISEFEENRMILCEDHLDSGTTITTYNPANLFIPKNYYETGGHKLTTDINLSNVAIDGVQPNTMISCIPLSIDVYFKATLGTT
jgi:hypothetical protein